MNQQEFDAIFGKEWVQTDEDAINYINGTFQALDKGMKQESSEIDEMAYRLVFLAGRKPELDIEYAKRFHQFPWISGFGDEWQLHVSLIMKGAFPLDEIPEHVRGILEEMYYKK